MKGLFCLDGPDELWFNMEKMIIYATKQSKLVGYITNGFMDVFSRYLGTTRFKQKEPEKKSRPLFLDHYYDNYDDPPLPAAWMLREIASFGFWAQVYDALVVGDRKQITQYWRHPNTQRIHEKLLSSWLWSISILRNRCAHHNRITHRHFAFPPKLPDKNPSKDLFYSKTDDLRTLLVIIFVLINCADPGYDFKGKLLALFNQYGQTVNIEKATGFSMEGKAHWHETGFWIHPADAK